MQSDVEQPTLTAGGDCRQTLHRTRIELAVTHDAQAPFALGDQHASVREKGERPRVLQPPGEDAHVNSVLLGSYRSGVGCEPCGRDDDGS